LEQRGNRFRVIFRLGGLEHYVSVKASDRREAEACLVRPEENLRLVERGPISIPACADPRYAAALKDIPCWVFHGDADRIVPVGATRDTVRAITAAGGRLQYQEYRGVDHNCWDHVYAEAELYHWLGAQALK
jgi:pimeloyl-ACP methyl ester carboxylesterase